jgi:oligosaccharide repeat unit polymerase
MELAAFLLLGLMIFMIVASPLGMISPSALLAGAWALVYTLQTVFAPDMRSSLLATSIIFLITLAFAVGEFIGCGGMKLDKPIGKERTAISSQASDDCKNARKLKLIVIFFGVFGLMGMVEYANVMGLLAARNLNDLILLPGIARYEVYSGERAIPMYSRIGVLFAYPGTVLALSYYYVYRWRWWLLLPIIGVLLFGMSQAGRAGTMIVLLQLVLSAYLKNVVVLKTKPTRTILKCAVVPGALMTIVFVGGQFLREGFHSTGREDVMRVIYSLRGYLFGGVSAFSYWIDNVYNWKQLTLGKYSFSSLFSVLGIAPQDDGVYNTYSPIASNGDSSNLYTAYRSFIDDYSVLGACLFYLMAGIFIASMTRSLTKGKWRLILVLIPMFSWLAFSPMYSITYFNSFLLSCFLPYFLVQHLLEVESDDN